LVLVSKRVEDQTGPTRVEFNSRQRLVLLGSFALVLLVVATGLAYRSVVQNGFFVGDDQARLRIASDPGGWSLFVGAPWILTGTRHLSFWRPVGTLAWRLNYLLTGPSAGAFFLVNLSLHLANGALVALLAVRFRRGYVVALTAAAVFVLHPIATETVSWLASRYDLLAVDFSLIALVCFVESRRAASRRWWSIGAVAAFVLAVLAKESAVVVPLMAVAIALQQDREGRSAFWHPRHLARAINSTIPLWVALALYLIVRTAQLGTVGTYSDYLTTGPGQIPENLLYHSRMIFFVPFDIDAYVARNEYIHPALAIPATVLPLVVVVILAALVPRVRFALTIILIALLPVVTINGGGRIVYLAIVGYALFVGEVVGLAAEAIAGWDEKSDRGPSRKIFRLSAASILLVGLTAAFLATYALTARDRNSLWTEAGKIVRSVPAQAVALYPGLPAGAIVDVRGLPNESQETYLFRNVPAMPFDVDGTAHLPDLAEAAWHQPSFGEIVPVTSFPTVIPLEDACRTFFAQFEHGALTWQPVPFPPTSGCRPAAGSVSLADTTATAFSFGNFARLSGYMLSPTSVVAGQPIQLDLVWQAQTPIPVDYKVFIHIAQGDNPPVAQRDSEPSDGRYPTTAWTPGLILRDSNRLIIPASLTPGTYDVVIGLYQSSSGERATAYKEGAPIGDHVVLTTLQVLAPSGQ
jgi:hypothetical protein